MQFNHKIFTINDYHTIEIYSFGNEPYAPGKRFQHKCNLICDLVTKIFEHKHTLIVVYQRTSMLKIL